MQQINWGIIGCGDVTEKKSGPAFGRIPGSSLVAVMRRTPGLAEDYARRHGVPRFYSDADQLIHDPEVNAIYVATPPSSHKEYALKILAAGKPVYVEKPMGTSYADCQAMAMMSEKSGMPLYVAYYRPYMPYFLKVQEILKSGRLGTIRHIHLRLFVQPRPQDHLRENLPWRVQPEIAGGGYFYDMAPHQLNLLIHWFGMPTDIYGLPLHLKNLYPAEDTVSASMMFSGKIPCLGSWNFVAGEDEEEDVIEIFGSAGTLSFSTFGFTPVKLTDAKGFETIRLEKNETVQYHLINEIVRHLQGLGPYPGSLEVAIQTNLLLDTILGKMHD